MLGDEQGGRCSSAPLRPIKWEHHRPSEEERASLSPCPSRVPPVSLPCPSFVPPVSLTPPGQAQVQDGGPRGGDFVGSAKSLIPQELTEYLLF